MIKVVYSKDDLAREDVNIHMTYHLCWTLARCRPTSWCRRMVTLTRTIHVKMDEPDIVLVNNIEDINTDAIMLNAELASIVTQQHERMSFNLMANRLRGPTCKFNPELREQSLDKILQPTNIGMHFSAYSEMAYYNSKFALWEPVIEQIGE